MCEMFKSGLGADVRIELTPPELSLSVHSSVLGSASPYFRRLLSEKPRRPDGTFLVTELADFTAGAVVIFLVDMYGMRADPADNYKASKDLFNICAEQLFLGALCDVGALIEMPLPPYVRLVDAELDASFASHGGGLSMKPKDGEERYYGAPIDEARARTVEVDYVIGRYNATLHTSVLSKKGVDALNAWLGRELITSVEMIDDRQWDTCCGDYTYKYKRLKINGHTAWQGKVSMDFGSRGISAARVVMAFLSRTVVCDEFM